MTPGKRIGGGGLGGGVGGHLWQAVLADNSDLFKPTASLKAVQGDLEPDGGRTYCQRDNATSVLFRDIATEVQDIRMSLGSPNHVQFWTAKTHVYRCWNRQGYTSLMLWVSGCRGHCAQRPLIRLCGPWQKGCQARFSPQWRVGS